MKPPDAEGIERSERAGVTFRIASLLAAFDERSACITLTELAQRSGLPRPTVHRMAHALREHNYLEQTDQGWRLGPRLFELGSLVESHRRLKTIAQPHMLDLFERTHKVVHLGVMDNFQVLYLEKLAGLTGPSLTTRAGGRRPLHSTALGKALLAFSPPGTVARVLSSPLPRFTPRTQIHPGILLEQLRRIRRDGYALEFEESRVGVSCIAAPVLGHDGLAVAALSITGRPQSMNVVQLATVVSSRARALSDEVRTAFAA